MNSIPPALRPVEQPPEQVLALFGAETLAERLQQIQSVTDAALAHLELDGLLAELLQRVRAVLDVDTVRVLLCMEDGKALAVRASLGLEHVGSAPVIIPVGQGLAGRVATERKAFIVDDVSAIDTVDPAIRVLASAMVAPLLIEGRLIGVLKVGTFTSRKFGDGELSVLQLVADRVALAVDRAQQHEKLRAEVQAHREAQDALRQSEERFRLLVEQVQDYAIFLLDPEGRIASWNRGAERLKGYREDEVLGRHFSLFYPPEVAQSGYPDRELEIAAREGRHEDEGWRIRRDGSRFWANAILTALHEGERLIGFAKVTRDLTDRRRVEESLRESEARFRVFAESAADAICIMDEDSRILYANPATQQVFGYRPEELLGQSMQLLIPEAYWAGHRAGVRHYLATGERRIPWSGVELPGLHKSGREVTLGISFGDYVRDGKHYFTGIARDVTERVVQQHQLEETAAELEATVEELQLRTEEAEAANRAKTEFMGVMSHELRTPLNAIIGYAELMRAGIPVPLPDASVRHVERIDRAARHQLELVEDILSFARLATGNEEAEWDSGDLGQIAREAADLILPLAQQKGLALRLHTPTPPLRLRTDPGKLRQAIANVLSNAVKFTDRGEIRITVERQGTRARVQIQDPGIGIAPQHRAKIFDPFWQVHQGTTRTAPGTGLGLTISHRILELLGGTISVSAAPDEGSVFTLEIPIV